MGIRFCQLVWIWSGGKTLTPHSLCPSGQWRINSVQCHDSVLFLPASSVCRFRDQLLTMCPSRPQAGDTKQHFLKLLMQQIQDSVVFEGPEGSKNLALDSQGWTQF